MLLPIKNITLEEWLEEMDSDNKRRDCKVAEKIELDTIYFLTGTEANEEWKKLHLNNCRKNFIMKNLKMD